jgi:hypothetical protein
MSHEQEHISHFFSLSLAKPPNGERYWRVGRADSLDRQKKLEARKMLEKPHRTHPSSARFVSPRTAIGAQAT